MEMKIIYYKKNGENVNACNDGRRTFVVTGFSQGETTRTSFSFQQT